MRARRFSAGAVAALALFAVALIIPVGPASVSETSFAPAPRGPLVLHDREESIPFSAPPLQAVTRTLDLYNNTTRGGNFLAANAIDAVAVAYDPTQGELFVTGEQTGTVLAIPDSGAVPRGIQPGCGNPEGIAFDSSQDAVFAACGGGLVEISASNLTLIRSVPLSGGPYSVAYDPAKRQIDVGGYGDNYVLNDSTGAVLATITAPPGGCENPVGITYAADSGEIFAACSGGGSGGWVQVINDTTLAVVTTIAMPFPVGAAADPVSHQVYVTSAGGGVAIISDRTNSIGSWTLNGTGTNSVFCDPPKNEVVVANSNNVSILSDRTNRTIANVSFPTAPTSGVYNPSLSMLEVLSGLNASGSGWAQVTGDTLYSISDATNRIVGSRPISSMTSSVVYDPYQSETFVASYDTGTVSVVSDASRHVVRTVRVCDNPDGMALDWILAEVYVACAGLGHNQIDTISALNDSVVATITLSWTPVGLVFDPARDEMFVGILDNTVGLWVLSDVTNTGVATLDLPYDWFGTQLAYDPARGEIVDGTWAGMLYFISDTTNAVVASMGVPGSYPSIGDVVFDNGNGDLYASDPGDGVLWVIAESTRSVVKQVSVPIEPGTLAYDSSQGEILALDCNRNQVYVVSDASNSIVQTPFVGTCYFPPPGTGLNIPLVSGSAFDPVHGISYFANQNSGTLSTLVCRSRCLYPTTFNETGLPAGSAWSMTYNGTTILSTSPSIQFSTQNGTYGFSVGPVWRFNSTPSSGSMTVGGYGLWQTIAFSPITSPLQANVTLAPYRIPLGGTTTATAYLRNSTSPVFTWSINGTQPLPCSSSTCAYSPSHGGRYLINLTVTDGSQTAWSQAPLDVFPVLSALSLRSSFPVLDLGMTTTIYANASGGTAPYTYAYPLLPPACISANSPTLSCQPSATGTFPIQAQVQDGTGKVVWANTSVKVNADFSISSFMASPSSIWLGNSTTLSVWVAGGTPPFSYSYSSLPNGCSSADTGNLSCTPGTLGTFTVTVQATDAYGPAVTSQTTLQVVNAPSALTATISAAPTSGAAPLPVDFSSTVSGGYYPYTLTWSFGDGSLGSHSPSPTHTYNTSGTFQVRLTVVDSRTLQTTAWLNVTAYRLPSRYTLTFTDDPASCPLTFNGSSRANGTTASFLAGNYTAFAPGCTGYVFSHFAYVIGGVGGVSTTNPFTLWIRGNGSLTAYYASPAPPRYTIQFHIPQGPCGPVIFNGSSQTDGSSASFLPGWYTAVAPTCAAPWLFVNWTYAWNGSTRSVTGSTTSINIVGNGNLSALYEAYTVSIAANRTSFYVGGSVSVLPAISWGWPLTFACLWALNGTNTTLTQCTSSGFSFSHAGTYTYALWVSDYYGHVVQSNAVAVTVTPLPAPAPSRLVAFENATYVSGAACNGLPLAWVESLAGNARGGNLPYAFSWSFGDGTPLQAGQNVSHTYTEAGSYTAELTVVDAKGHLAFANATVNVAPPACPSRGNPGGGGGISLLGLSTLATLALVAGLVAALLLAVVAVVLKRRRKERPPPDGSAPSGEGASADPNQDIQPTTAPPVKEAAPVRNDGSVQTTTLTGAV